MDNRVDALARQQVWGDVRVFFKARPGEARGAQEPRLPRDQERFAARCHKSEADPAAGIITPPRNRRGESKRDSSLRKPTASQEQAGEKRRRPAPFGMTVGCGGTESAPQGVWWLERADTSAGGNRWVKKRACPKGQAKEGRKQGETRLQTLK
jgi:hypothetical protein